MQSDGPQNVLSNYIIPQRNWIIHCVVTYTNHNTFWSRFWLTLRSCLWVLFSVCWALKLAQNSRDTLPIRANILLSHNQSGSKTRVSTNRDLRWEHFPRLTTGYACRHASVVIGQISQRHSILVSSYFKPLNFIIAKPSSSKLHKLCVLTSGPAYNNSRTND